MKRKQLSNSYADWVAELNKEGAIVVDDAEFFEAGYDASLKAVRDEVTTLIQAYKENHENVNASEQRIITSGIVALEIVLQTIDHHSIE